LADFARVLLDRYRVALRGAISPRMLSQIAGRTVKNLHDAMVEQGHASSIYERIVDGRVGAAETSIKLDLETKRSGVILYRSVGGDSLAAAAALALREAERMSPRLSGAYSRAWIAIVDGVVWEQDVTRIPPSAEQVVVANYAPYARRLEQEFGVKGGHFTSRTRRRIKGGHPQYIVTLTVADLVRTRFQGLNVRRRFISMPAFARGKFRAPYIRQRSPRGPILYPAVVIERRTMVRN